jgi:Rrf2 family protein
MIPLPRRALSAIAAVTDIALHARPTPVSAKALAGRLGVAPRHLEPVLQALVRGGILKGVRGPRGGYELARERRRITVGDVVRVPDLAVDRTEPEDGTAASAMEAILAPALAPAGHAFMAALDAITVEQLCRAAGRADAAAAGDFTI